MNQQGQVTSYAITAVLLWSTVATAFKLSLRHLDPFQLLFYANLASILALFFVLIAQRKLSLLNHYSAWDLLHCALLGFLNPFLYYCVLFKAYDMLPAQEAQALNYTWAITLAVLSVPVLKQKIGFKEIAAMLVSYLGVLIVSTHGDLRSMRFSNTTGVGLALTSTVIWALYWIYNTKNRNDAVINLFLNFTFAFPFVLFVTIVFSSVKIPSLPGLLGAGYVGIVEMGITFVIWLKALRLSSSTAKTGSLIFFSPFLSLIFIQTLVGEQIRVSTLIGLLFIASGTLLQKLAGKNPTLSKKARNGLSSH